MAAAEPNDAVLVARALRGERDAFHALVQRHSGPLWSAVRRFLDTREDARDVFQETWLVALGRLGELRQPEKLRSWLVSIALNLCRQRARHASAAPGFQCEPLAGDLHASDLGQSLPESAAAHRELELAVEAAISELPARQRQVLELRLRLELSHREIAGLLGISAESARANLYQALKRVRSRCAVFERSKE